MSYRYQPASGALESCNLPLQATDRPRIGTSEGSRVGSRLLVALGKGARQTGFQLPLGLGRWKVAGSCNANKTSFPDDYAKASAERGYVTQMQGFRNIQWW